MTAVATNMTCTRKARLAPLAWVARAFQTRRERDALARLEGAALKDLGLTEGQARREADRPLWDVPAHWTC